MADMAVGRDRRTLRLLMTGSSVSMLGSRVTTIAYPMLVLYLTGSPVDAGWVAFAAVAPSVLVYIPAGALVDLLDPKRVMLLTEAGRGTAIASVFAMVMLGGRSMPLFILAAIIEETLEVFATLAERRYIRALVGQDRAAPALVRVEARTHVVVLTGRPLGGLLFEAWPLAPFLFDVLTFIVSVGTLLGIKKRRLDRATFTSLGRCICTRDRFMRAITRLDQPPAWHIKTDIGDGARQLWSDHFARAAVALLASTTLIFQALIMVFIAEAHARHLSPVSVGIVLAMSGVGGAVGSALASRLRDRLPYFRTRTGCWIQIQMLVWAAAFFLLKLAGGQSSAYMAIAMAVLGLMGAMSNIGLDTYLIEHVPENMLAKVTSICRLMSFTACAAGPLIGGFLFQRYGAHDGVQDTIGWLMAGTICLAVYSLCASSMHTSGNGDATGVPEQRAGDAPPRDMVAGRPLTGLASGMEAISCCLALAVRNASLLLQSWSQVRVYQGGQVPGDLSEQPHPAAEPYPPLREASRP